MEFELCDYNENIMAPSLEQLTARFESACEKIQDSIMVIESQMGREQQFTFDMNREIYSLETMDISGTEDEVNRYIIVLNEYKKILGYEKSRRRLDSQIKSVCKLKTFKLKTFKENLMNTRRGKRLQTKPYERKELVNTE